MLFAEGKESTIITVSENTGSGGGSSRRTTTRTYSEINTFFAKDLSYSLQKSVSSNLLDEGTLEILPQNKEIAFKFGLPSVDNLFSSYKGKHANIIYTVKAIADIAKRLDVNEEERFSVFNYSNNKVALYSSNTSSLNEDNRSTTTASSNIFENENNSLPSLTMMEIKKEDANKESYSARFERIFGKKSNSNITRDSHSPSRSFTLGGAGINFDLGSIFAKGRQHFLKENSEARIDLLDNKTQYSPGHIVKGNVTLLTQNQEKEKGQEKKEAIRGMEIILNGIEHAFAQGLERVSTIEKYERKIAIDQNGRDNNNNNTIPFEFQIPNRVNQSYTGKYSEYFWGLEAKLNIAWSSDINARTIIEIV